MIMIMNMYSAKTIACVAGVRKGRGREFGRTQATKTIEEYSKALYIKLKLMNK